MIRALAETFDIEYSKDRLKEEDYKSYYRLAINSIKQ